MGPDPKSAKKTDNFTVFFVLSGSGCIKAAHRTLVKLTPGSISSTFYAHVFCTKVLCAAFI